jgi:hypothetical protein
MRFAASQSGFQYDFHYKQFVPGPQLYCFIVAAGLLSVVLGIVCTEPDYAWSNSHTEVQYNDRYNYSSFGEWYTQTPQYNIGSLFESLVSDSGSDSDESTDGKIAIVIIVAIIALVIAAAVIQHFWVISSISIGLILLQFLYRTWKYD